MMNCLAVIGNVMPQSESIDYFAAEKVLFLVEVLQKRYLSLSALSVRGSSFCSTVAPCLSTVLRMNSRRRWRPIWR